MSKYQTALNLLKGWARNDRNANSPKHLENIEDRCKVLQELVDKEVPKKVKVVKGVFREEIHCPICSLEVLSVSNYCHKCGQRLDSQR